jgi:hypothetical protein
MSQDKAPEEKNISYKTSQIKTIPNTKLPNPKCPKYKASQLQNITSLNFPNYKMSQMQIVLATTQLKPQNIPTTKHPKLQTVQAT